MRIHSFYDPNSQMARHKWPKCESMKAHFFLLCNFVVNASISVLPNWQENKGQRPMYGASKNKPIEFGLVLSAIINSTLIDSAGNGEPGPTPSEMHKIRPRICLCNALL